LNEQHDEIQVRATSTFLFAAQKIIRLYSLILTRFLYANRARKRCSWGVGNRTEVASRSQRQEFF
jgi:hypothetical protein